MYNDELYHHGIFGQKWGKRNGPPYPLKASDHSASEKKAGWKKSLSGGKPSTNRNGNVNYRASDAQVQKAKDLIKDNRFSRVDVSDNVFDTVGADKRKLASVREELNKCIEEQKQITKETDEMFKELDNNPKTRAMYEATSEIADNMLTPYDGKDHKMTAEEVGWAIFMGCYEDGQQGRLNAYSLYAYDNNLEDKIDKLSIRANKATDYKREGLSKVVDEALQSVGDTRIKDYSKYETTGEALVYSMLNSREEKESWDSISGKYRVWDAYYASNIKKQPDVKKVVEKAKNITKNLDTSDVNNWWYFNEAVDKLGFSQVPAEDLSKTQWEAINKEMRNLRKENKK